MNKLFLLSFILIFSGAKVQAAGTCTSQLSLLHDVLLPEALVAASAEVQKLAKDRETTLRKNILTSVTKLCGESIDDCSEEKLREAVHQALHDTVKKRTKFQAVVDFGYKYAHATRKYALFTSGMTAYVALITSDWVSKEMAVIVTVVFQDPLRNMMSLVMEPLNAAGRALMVKKGSHVSIRQMNDGAQTHYHNTYWRSQGLNDLTLTGQYREQLLIPEFMTALKTASSYLQTRGPQALPRVADLMVTTAWDFFEHYPDIDLTFVRFQKIADSLLGRHDLNHSMEHWDAWITARDATLERLAESQYPNPEDGQTKMQALQSLTRILDAWFPPPL